MVPGGGDWRQSGPRQRVGVGAGDIGGRLNGVRLHTQVLQRHVPVGRAGGPLLLRDDELLLANWLWRHAGEDKIIGQVAGDLAPLLGVERVIESSYCVEGSHGDLPLSPMVWSARHT